MFNKTKKYMIDRIINESDTAYDLRTLEGLTKDRVRWIYENWFGSQVFEASKVCWFVRRKSDDKILAIDGEWYTTLPNANMVKLYSTSGRASRYGLKGASGVCYAIMPGEALDTRGSIHKLSGRPELVYKTSAKYAAL